MARMTNLNADIAEGWGAYDVGDDDALMDIVKSANVACGFHAGDPNTMHRLVKLADEKGVSIGAHPGFNDLWGFGRRQIRMNTQELEYMIAYQIGALQAIASYAGQPVTHVKAHGALSNMACEDEGYATAIGRAIKAVDDSLIYVVLPNTELEVAGETLGLRIAREGFADRQYDDNCNLVSRTHEGSVYKDPVQATEQVLRMVEEGKVVSRGGKEIDIRVDTICVHGDEPTAVKIAGAVRDGLIAAGIEIVPMPEMGL